MSYAKIDKQRVIDACEVLIKEIKEERDVKKKEWCDKYDIIIKSNMSYFFGLLKQSYEESKYQLISGIHGDAVACDQYYKATRYGNSQLSVAKKLLELAKATEKEVMISSEDMQVICKYLGEDDNKTI